MTAEKLTLAELVAAYKAAGDELGGEGEYKVNDPAKWLRSRFYGSLKSVDGDFDVYAVVVDESYSERLLYIWSLGPGCADGAGFEPLAEF